MKAEIRITAEAAEPFAVIYAREITDDVLRTAALIEKGLPDRAIAVSENGRIIILQPEGIYMVRVEGEKTCVYAEDKKYASGKRLYEMEDALGTDFMRISRSTIVNLKQLDSVEPTLGGLMLLRLKNGCSDYISRRYLPAFRKYLGI